MSTSLILAIILAAPANSRATVTPATVDKHGVRVHTVKSDYQAGATKIRVLLTRFRREIVKLRVVYVLPVEAKDGTRYGDGLLEIKKLNLHNTHNVICVAPTFSHLPWYADHPTDKTIRQESYLLKVVVPFVEKTYLARAERDGRLLLGFSKSGWGAFSLLLRNPKTFGKAAAWDAPLMMKPPGKYGSKPIFGTVKNFERYRISRLIGDRAKAFRKSPRFILTGYGNFRSQHIAFRKLLVENKIAHVYRDGPKRRHHWNGGWVKEAFELLVKRK